MLLLIVAAVTFGYGAYRLLQIGRREPGLPPGPPTVPLFGNMLQIPPTQTEWQLTEWHKQYGPIISLKLGGDTLIVIKDREAIRDLWEKNSQNYSDRADSYVAKLLTDQHHAAFQSMGDSWRDRRKLISHHFSPQQCDTLHAPYQNAEAVALTKTLLEEPENFFKLVKRFAAAVTGSLTYGKRPKTFEDPLCQNVVEAMSYIAENMELGATPPVDVFPFTLLQYVPSSVAFWKRRAIQHGKKLDALFAKLWSEFIARRDAGRRNGCLFDKFLQENEQKADSPGLLGSWRWGLHSLQFLGGEILEGGADTTSSTLLSFIMAMACNPGAQEKAQKQIDEHVGSERTPHWIDYNSIPYVAQIQKETIRWRPVTVTGTPHQVHQDDTYKGFKFPKGARTMQNTWALHMDETYYENPEEFIPERYDNRTKLADHYQGNADWKNRDHYGYGGGRRICPGMHIAERNLWWAMSKILWGFNITRPTDPRTGEPEFLNTAAFTKNGEVSAFEGGAVRVAKPFKVKIQPRSAQHAAVIEKEYNEVLPLLAMYD